MKLSDTLVLCYHAISAGWGSPLAVTPAQFEAQIRYLVSRGYRGTTFSDAVAGGVGKRVAVTFDDGYRSILELAKPILDAHGMPATVFVPTDFIDRDRLLAWPGIDHWLGGPQEAELRPMSWQDAATLIEAGWEIGSHTCSHPHLTELDDARLRAEMRDSRAECERRLDRPCRSIAFPYGDFDERVSAAAREAGYEAAAAIATDRRPDPHRWPRVGVYRVDGTRAFKLKVSRPVRAIQASRVWPPLAAIVHRARPGNEAAA